VIYEVTNEYKVACAKCRVARAMSGGSNTLKERETREFRQTNNVRERRMMRDVDITLRF